ncbi:MAG: methyltransferase domain-containing protein [Pirellulaceae bacterium]|nr:methyltransferase domain-containing protein [Pirellulaceae bacterium]
MSASHRPTWQLPPGVSRGTWDYVSTPSIATEYDSFHGDHPLMRLDQQWIAERLNRLPATTSKDPRVLIDLGCGTGRALLPWNDRGWRTIGIDLSIDMLRQAKLKCEGNANRPDFMQANLAQLDGLSDRIADVALCLYSSFGMVRGRQNRLAMLRGVRRSLKEGGLFFVHVHNRGSWLRDPDGIRTTVRSYIRAVRERESEFGDRIYAYRGLPSMFLHIFSQRELRLALIDAGFAIESMYVLNRTSSGPLRCPWWLPHLRAGGFMATAVSPPNVT